MSISRFRSAIENIKTSKSKAEAFSVFINAYAKVPEGERHDIFKLILDEDKKNKKCKKKLENLMKAISFSHEGYTHFSVEVKGTIKPDQIPLVKTVFKDEDLISFLETIEYSDNNKVKFNQDTVDNLCAMLLEEKDEITKSPSLIEKAGKKVGSAIEAVKNAKSDLVDRMGKKSSQSLYDDSPELADKKEQLKSALERHKNSPKQARKDASRPQSQPVLTSTPESQHTRAASVPVLGNPPPPLDTPPPPPATFTGAPPPPPLPSFNTPGAVRRIPTMVTRTEPEKRKVVPGTTAPTDHQAELAKALTARAKKTAESSEQKAKEIEEKIVASKQPPKANNLESALLERVAATRIPTPSLPETEDDDAFTDSPRRPTPDSETLTPLAEDLVKVTEEVIIIDVAEAKEASDKQNRVLKQLLDDLDNRQVYQDAISHLNLYAIALNDATKSGDILAKQAAFITPIWNLTVALAAADSQAYIRFNTHAADPLNILIKDVFDSNKSEQEKIKSLDSFRTAGQAFIDSYTTDNASKQKWHKIIKGIIVSAAVLIGIGIGIGVTLATGGTMTLPYIGLLSGAYALLAGGAMGAAGGGLIGSVGTSIKDRFFKPVDKQVSPSIQTAIEAIDESAASLRACFSRRSNPGM